jgi:hypothetical protein
MQASGQRRGREALGLDFRIDVPDLKGAEAPGGAGQGAWMWISDLRFQI